MTVLLSSIDYKAVVRGTLTAPANLFQDYRGRVSPGVCTRFPDRGYQLI